MSRKSSVALCCVVVLAIGSWAVAQQNENSLLQPAVQARPGIATIQLAPSEESAAVDVENLQIKGTEQNPLYLTPREGETIFRRADGTIESEAGPYKVVALKDSAILLEVQSGRTWIMREGSWKAMPRDESPKEANTELSKQIDGMKNRLTRLESEAKSLKQKLKILQQ